VLSERCLREIYLKGFEIAVKEAAPLALMSSYNKINGVHSANNRELITNILRDEWGFKGMVMTDWTSTWHGDGCSASGCVKAGNDLIMPGSREDLKDIEGALKEGLIGIDDIKANAYHIVRTILNTAGQDG